MSREKKAETIDRLQAAFSKASISILTDYRGLATSEMTDLRRRLQGSGGEYKVVKNTLARFAVARAGKEDFASSFEGPIAVAFGYGDVVAPAKVLASFIAEANTSLSIKGGLLGDRVLTSEEVISLARLPSREVLLARALGQMKSPIWALVNCLAAPMREMIGVLQARITQLEGE